ncbi:hypothetical protein Pint_21662 [Pistacia integerrima]|uniref:Uncharacterized protein n=1 Tax=Pistacia integerrima TaxID=434235 RepID=A0ACC0XBM0_9ROSI|nr:hypothetical protein Pint_21662 [Pistacia integerrima]
MKSLKQELWNSRKLH